MGKYRVGVIGCGDNTKRKDAMGYAMAWEHGIAYGKLPEQCEIVACADTSRNGEFPSELDWIKLRPSLLRTREISTPLSKVAFNVRVST